MLKNLTRVRSECLTPATLVELLRERARQRGGQTAYTFLGDGLEEADTLTYGELDRRARAVAARLQSAGAAGGRVLLLFPAGLDYVAAFFGCLYAGAVAVPSYPPKFNRSLLRFRSIVEDAQAAFVLTTEAIRSRAESHPEGPARGGLWLTVEEIDEGAADEWREPRLEAGSLAFLQYTSGSTSAPKGVAVTHANLLHNQRLIQTAFRQTAESVIVSWLPLYHDMGLIGTVLQPLYLGASCVLMSPVSFLQRPARWLEAISRYGATTSGGPNFAYELCAQKVEPAHLEGLDLSSWQVAFNGAEPVRAETLDRFAAAFAPYGFRREAFAPCYGLAEATLLVSSGGARQTAFSCFFDGGELARDHAVEVAPGSPGVRRLVSCGAGSSEQQIAVVNPETLRRCAAGKVGEVWVSGPSVAAGYWNRPAESAQTFAAYTADTGEGPYLRTGDLGFFRGGELFITGRLKDLVIIRGQNHYPQDIELVAGRSHPRLRQGSGVAFSYGEGEEQLAVVHEVSGRASDDLEEIINAVRESVSEAFELQVSAVALVRQGGLPKTSSGKLQRHACRAAWAAGSLEVLAEWKAGAGANRRESEPAVAASDTRGEVETWITEQLAARSNESPQAFDLDAPVARYGIDSLASVELAHAAETRFGVRLDISEVLGSPSIAQLAALISQQRGEDTGAAAGLDAQLASANEEEGPLLPASQNQKSLWFIQQLAPESAAYNVAAAVRVNSELDPAALREALRALVSRHAALRTTFVASDGTPYRQVRAESEPAFQHEDVSGLTNEALEEHLANESHAPFDLSAGPLLRISLFTESARRHTLLLVAHHLVVDFWSLEVLLRELCLAYEAEASRKQHGLEPLKTSYTEYVRRQAAMLAGADGERLWAYWRGQLGGELPSLDLLTDRPRPPVQSFRGASVPFSLDAELTRQVRALSRAHGTTVYVVLLAAFQTLLHRHTGQKEILVGSPTAGRGRADLAPLVGYFVNPVALRADFDGDPTFEQFVRQTRETVLGAFAHQEFPFGLLVERLQPVRDPSRQPIFQAMFVMLAGHSPEMRGLAAHAVGAAGSRMQLGGLSLESTGFTTQTSQFDLTLNVAETGDTISGNLLYSTDIFEEETARRLAERFGRLVGEAVSRAGERVSTLEVMGEAERHLVLEEWNRTELDYDRTRCLHELIEEQARLHPERVALV
ncbi:MAG TPA: condensation domain-containing protein, partial [Pyrinomonadaceae bacterium]